MKHSIWLALLLLGSSCTATWHLKRAKRHELIAISKGAIVEVDTVYKEVTVEITVPGERIEVPVNVSLDTPRFMRIIGENDSLVRANLDLQVKIQNDLVPDKEKAMAQLRASRAREKDLKDELIRGFIKDSIYVFAVDSISSVSIKTEGGIPVRVIYDRDDVVVRDKKEVPVEVKRLISTAWSHRNSWIVWWIFFVVGFVVGWRVAKKIKSS